MAPKHILLAEDDDVLLDVLKTKLEKNGFKVFPVINGVEALNILAKEPIDMVLTDILMPEMGGFELIERMKADEKLKNIPIIILSNSGQPVEIHQAIKMGVEDYLTKAEFDPQEVLDKVQKHLKEPKKASLLSI